MTAFPIMKLKALVNFPTAVQDGIGIDSVKQNGIYQFNLDYGDFMPPVGVLPDPANQNVLAWNPQTGVFSLVPVPIIGVGGAVPEAPADGVVYGRKTGTWVNAWFSTALTGAPTAPTPAPGDNSVSIATTAFVAAAAVQPSNAAPLQAGIAAPGIAVTYSRGDHVHPTDATRAPLASPIFTGDPRAPTALPGDNDTSIATTAFVTNAVAGIAPSGAVPLMDGLGTAGVAVTYARGDHIHPVDTSRAPLASPAFTGSPTSPTPAPGDNSLSIATTAFVAGGFIGEAPNDGSQYARQNKGWTVVVGGGGGGSVTGPAGATADHIVTFNGPSGSVIKDSGKSIADLTVTPAALTRVNDANITMTLAGAAATALLQPVSITLGWAGTLAPSRGGFGADVSAQSGIPLFAAGVPTFTPTTGTGNVARANSPAFTGVPTSPTPPPGNNSTALATTAFIAAMLGGTAFRSYLAGLTLLYVGTGSFSVGPGLAADSTNVAMMNFAGVTKTLGAWAVGGGNGSLDTGAIAANSCYHVHEIMRTDTGVIDVLLSLSPTAPALPSPYTLFRRLGSLFTNASSNLLSFVQTGDEVIFSASISDVSVTNLGTASQLYPLTVPTGVQVNALGRASISSATTGTNILIQPPDQTTEAVVNVPGNASITAINATTTNRNAMNIRTDTSGRIRAVAGAGATTFQWVTYGYIDRRGKDA